MFWLLTLPFRIAFGLLLAALSLVAVIATVVLLPLVCLVWLPILLLRGGVRLIGGLVIALVLGAGAILLTAVVLLPLVPVVACLAALWMVARVIRRPTRHGFAAG